MSLVFPLQFAGREFRLWARSPRRGARPLPPVPDVLEAARNFDLGELGGRAQLGTPRQLLIRGVGHLERSDWAILFTVAMAIAALMVLGVLGMRLASLSPTVAAPARGAAAASSTQAFQTLAAPSPVAVAAPAPTAAPAPASQLVSTVDAGSPGAGARLRAAPRLDANIVERIVHGTQVTEVGPEAAEGQRTWRQVKSPSGNVGWMDASLLKRTGR